MWWFSLCLLLRLGGAAVLGEHHGQERVLHGKRLSDRDHHLDDEGHEEDFDYDHEAFLGADEAHEFDDLDPEESKRRLGVIVVSCF